MPTIVGDNSTHALKGFVTRIESLDEEKGAIQDQIKFVFAEAKAAGLNVRALRRIIRDRKRDAEDVAQEEADLEIYRAALGGLATLPLGEAAIARIRG